MSTRQRWLAAVRREPVDRLPFWPKILSNSYINVQSYPFNKMSVDEVINWTESDRQIFLPQAVVEKRNTTSINITEKDGIKSIKYITKYGTTENILKFDLGSCSWHPIKMAINSPDDINLMTAFFEDCNPIIDNKILEEAEVIRKRFGDTAVFAEAIGESPLMNFIEWYAGVQNSHIMLADHRSKVEELFHEMHKVLLKKTKIISENSPSDILYFIENTSTTLISPDQFKNYPLKHLNEYGNLIKDSGKLFILHMCGHLKALLGDIDKIKADAIEAFTSPPVGNTRLIDGKLLCPSKALIGGTNAVLWTKSTGRIIEEIERDLGELTDHRGIAVTSAGVMPPVCKPETIKEIGRFIKSYAVKM